MKVQPINNNVNNKVQVNRHMDVPFESVWYLVLFPQDGGWDIATRLNNLKHLIEVDKDNCLIFAVWHGQYRTNLFLMPADYCLSKIASLQNCNNVKQKKPK